jgi:hypothetical protein
MWLIGSFHLMSFINTVYHFAPLYPTIPHVSREILYFFNIRGL